LRGVVMNITPSLTIGGDWCASVTPVEKVHAGFSAATFAGVIWSSGL